MLKSLFAGQLPKAALFDLDGTLIDSVPGLAEAVDLSLAAMGFPAAGEEKVRLWVGNGAKVLLVRALADAQKIAEEAVLSTDIQQAQQWFVQFYQKTAASARLYPGVFETLQSLEAQGVRMALITNKPVQFLPDLLKTLNVEAFFDEVLGGDSLTEKKPHPAPLLHVLELMQLPAVDCVMVGDSANDVLAAKAAGLKSVCVSYGYNYGQSVHALGACAVIDCFSDLLN